MAVHTVSSTRFTALNWADQRLPTAKGRVITDMHLGVADSSQKVYGKSALKLASALSEIA